MIVFVHTGISENSNTRHGTRLDAPFILYGSDGDGTFYYHLFDVNWNRTGGGSYAPGRWNHISEDEPVQPHLRNAWHKMQNKFVEDPARIPG